MNLLILICRGRTMKMHFGLLPGEKLIVTGLEPVWDEPTYKTIGKPTRVKVVKEYPTHIVVKKTKQPAYCLSLHKADILTQTIRVTRVATKDRLFVQGVPLVK